MMKYKYMYYLAWINILKKGKRTRLSLIATVLSTAIIFSSAILFKNVSEIHDMTTTSISHYHYALKEIDEVQLSQRYLVSYEGQTSLTTSYHNEEYAIHTLEVEDEVLPFVLLEGCLPETSDELLVSSNSSFHLNEQLSLQHSDGTIGEYKVVGIYESDELFESIHSNQKIIYTQTNQSSPFAFYVYDNQAYLNSSFQSLIEKLDIISSQVYTHESLISVDTIKTYLQDTTFIKVFYVAIICLCITMSLISIYNVFLISDQSRKREIGLLKSVGASPNAISVMLKTELVILGSIGAFLGLGLGSVVSYFILSQLMDALYLNMSYQLLFSPLVLIVSYLSGFLLMYLSGLLAYRKYFYSSPIEDLKEVNYDFMPPTKTEPLIFTGFGWQMFSIYNRRMKKQTRNIQNSFILLLVTSVLFLCVASSTMLFKNQNVNKGYDLEVKSTGTVIPEVSYSLKALKEDETLAITNLEVTRFLQKGFRTELDSYDNWYNEMETYKSQTNITYYEATDKVGDTWVNVYHYPTAFDKEELEALKPYLVDGTLDNLSDREVIAVFRDSYLGAQFCDNFEVGDIVAYYLWYDENGGPNPIRTKDMAMKMMHGRRLSAIVILPEAAAKELGSPFSEYERIMAFSLDSAYGNLEYEKTTFMIKNTANSLDLQERIEAILLENGAQNAYEIQNIALQIENNKITAFMMEVLLYPLFFLLFIVSFMNIHNVLDGNLLLKQKDIAIMRCVGIGKKQLQKMIIYEYLEGYFNGGLVTILLFLPIGLIENYFGLLSAFDFVGNLFGTMIAAICFLGILLLMPLVIENIKKFQAIKALDALKE